MKHETARGPGPPAWSLPQAVGLFVRVSVPPGSKNSCQPGQMFERRSCEPSAANTHRSRGWCTGPGRGGLGGEPNRQINRKGAWEMSNGAVKCRARFQAA